MKRKISLTVIIFFSAFMLNFSVMAFQQRYDRRKDDHENDPHAIELADLHAFKFLKNTCFYEFPLSECSTRHDDVFFNEDFGFGNKHTFVFQPFTTCQLKFVLIEYIGFYDQGKEDKTFLSGFGGV